MLLSRNWSGMSRSTGAIAKGTTMKKKVALSKASIRTTTPYTGTV